MNINNPELITDAEERFKDVQMKEVSKETKQDAFEADTEQRVERREEYLKETVAEPLHLARERIMGKSDLMSINYLQLGYLAAFSVCRIHVRNINGGNAGYGTGFLISPNLLITNNHVLEAKDFAVKSLAEFNYQYNVAGEPSKTFFFDLRPDLFFKTNARLDYTVVAVNPVSRKKDKKLKDFSFLRLYEDAGKALLSEHLSIIQHPGGGFKQIAIRENRLSGVVSDFVTYSTDTTQGSSGSCVFNDQWQVVALHHSGVPRKDANGRWLKKDGTVWKTGEDDSLIDWISNEGIRISSIVADLKSTHASNALFKEMFSASIVTPEAVWEEIGATRKVKTTEIETDETEPEPDIEEEENNMNDNANQQNSITVTIPIEVTVRVGSAAPAQATAKPAPAKTEDAGGDQYVLTESVQPDYSNRNGYQSNFVKTNNFKIELMDLVDDQLDKLAPLTKPTADNKFILKYHNFSVILNKIRKLCVVTAVNIDGNKSKQLGRENTPWILDPRVASKFQAGPAVYKNNDLDRGHMVRRLDPVWGPNALAANDDTFHLTNSTPQHKNLNQKTWLSLEDFVLNSADKENFKVSVFTGPIFGDEDIPYRGILLPLQFYKVAAMIKKDGTPSVTGYMLAQPAEIDDFREEEGIRDTGFGQFKTYQVPLARIANLTGLRFDEYTKYDPLGDVDPTESTGNIEITGAEDIKF